MMKNLRTTLRLRTFIPSLYLAGSLLVSGCGPKKAPAPEAATDAPAAQPPPESRAPVAGQTVESAPANPPETLPAPSAEFKGTAVHQELTAAVHRFLQQNGQLPATFEVLAKAGFIKPMPAPPGGKKFVLDRQNLQVMIVDQ